MQINDNIKKARVLAGYKSQGKFAKMLDLTRDQYKVWENETMPQADILYKISQLVGISMEQLLKSTGDLSPDLPTIVNSNNVEGKLEAIEHLLEKTRGELLMIVSDGDTSLVRKINKRRGKPDL